MDAQNRCQAASGAARNTRLPCFLRKQGGTDRRGDARYNQARMAEKGRISVRKLEAVARRDRLFAPELRGRAVLPKG